MPKWMQCNWLCGWLCESGSGSRVPCPVSVIMFIQSAERWKWQRMAVDEAKLIKYWGLHFDNFLSFKTRCHNGVEMGIDASPNYYIYFININDNTWFALCSNRSVSVQFRLRSLCRFFLIKIIVSNWKELFVCELKQRQFILLMAQSRKFSLRAFTFFILCLLRTMVSVRPTAMWLFTLLY